MSKLSLVIKDTYFRQKLSGEVKTEVREIRPNTANKYCEFNANGDLIGPKKYDSIELYVGYNPDRPKAEFEILNSEIRLLQDEESGEYITYMHNGEEYIESMIVFDLGKVLKKVNC